MAQSFTIHQQFVMVLPEPPPIFPCHFPNVLYSPKWCAGKDHLGALEGLKHDGGSGRCSAMELRIDGVGGSQHVPTKSPQVIRLPLKSRRNPISEKEAGSSSFLSHHFSGVLSVKLRAQLLLNPPPPNRPQPFPSTARFMISSNRRAPVDPSLSNWQVRDFHSEWRIKRFHLTTPLVVASSRLNIELKQKSADP